MRFNCFPPGIPVIKRLFDLIITIPGLILASPIMACIAIVLWVKNGRPVIFKQQRPGYRGKIFTLYKFRTMRPDAINPQGNVRTDNERITGFGRFLRSTSLDELPELINILSGDMSLVGPRPLLVAYLDRYTTEQRRRHDVLPGMAGWAQINGRNLLTWDQKFSYDLWYVDHWSLGLDIKILVLTIWKVLKREGISPPGQATMEEFLGSSEK